MSDLIAKFSLNEQQPLNATFKINAVLTDVTEIEEKIDAKQDKLTAGENITIVNNVISATGGGGGGTSKTKLSQFTDDLGSSPVHTHSQYLTEHQSLSAYALKSELPTKTSQLTNDSGFLTQHQDISGKQDISTLETDVKEFINEEYILSFIQDGTEVSY